MKSKLLPIVLLFSICIPTSAQENVRPQRPSMEHISPPAKPSKIPVYRFGTTLEEQQTQLAENPYLDRLRKARKIQESDPYRPIYHYVNPEGRLNDPNGLCYWKGRWHLFYQAYPPEDTRQHWGHAVSDDLIHWRDLPIAIYPVPDDKCFSGATYVDTENNRVIAAYHGIGRGTMVAVSKDPLLLNWEKVTGDAVIKMKNKGEPDLPYEIFDPSIWKQGEYYYILTGGQSTTGPGGKVLREEFLHRSKDLSNWEYLHPFLEDDHYGIVGDDGACPYFWPIGPVDSKTGESYKHIMLHFSHMTGGKYMIGDYDTKRQKFAVTDGGDFNFGPVSPGGTHAPSACPDPENPEAVIGLFNMNPGMTYKNRNVHWNQIMSLPRRYTIDSDGKLKTEPAGDIESLRKEHVRLEGTDLPMNTELNIENVNGNALELIAHIDPANSKMIEVKVLRSPNDSEYTRILYQPFAGYQLREKPRRRDIRPRTFTHGSLTIDSTRSSTHPRALSRPPEVAPVLLEDPSAPVKLRVFVDRSIVEVFVNDRLASAVRVYPKEKDSTGVSLRAIGGDAKLISLDSWQMDNIYANQSATN